jgi:hypothetical protein
MSKNEIMDNLSADVAILFLIFNRPNCTSAVINRLKSIRPTRLYIAADGPRSWREGERALCNEARSIATAIYWPCEIRTLWRDTNLGCKQAVSSAIEWFFKYEEEGIILEDDCLPHIDFFRFCAHGLNLYRHDERVFVITGDNFQDGNIRGQGGSYYFSKFPHCWGWATWRRAWKVYDESLSFFGGWVQSSEWLSLHSDAIERGHWEQLAEQVVCKRLDSWATPWMFSVWFHNGLTMTPNVNLVTNIGFGSDATHTVTRLDDAAGLEAFPLGDFQETDVVTVDRAADRYVFFNHFGGRSLIFPYKLIVWVKRILLSIGRKVYVIHKKLHGM